MKTFPLTVSSPDGDAFSGEAVCLSLRGTAGDLAVMAGHIPFVTSVVPCTVRITRPSEEEITQGFTGGDIIRQDGVYVWGAQPGASGSPDQTAALMVNINTATEEELKSLPGIGEVTAKAIINYRKDTPFKTIDDIKNVTGIGESKFKQIKDYICV